MNRPRKWDSDEQRRKVQNELRKIQRANVSADFVCLDGEGSGNWRDHRYCLFGVGSGYISDPAGLDYDRVFSYLWANFLDNPGAIFAGFYLGYDFTQWFKTLPQGKARLLFDNSSRKRTSSGKNHTPFPVRLDGWEFDILGMKRFKLRREGHKSWMYVNDTGPFFQASLLSVIDPRKWSDPVVTQEEYDIIEEGKRKRDVAVLGEEMIKYNALENDILRRVLLRYQAGIETTGVRLKRNQWFGPGQAAQSWLSLQDNVPKSSDIPRESEYARYTYYGGWFEIMAHGHVPGVTHEYDINSAYPWIISRLPCLLHGQWVKDSNVDHERSVTIVHALVRGSHPNIGSMPHRRPDGRVLRPYNTAGWHWKNELDAAKRAGLIDYMDIDQTWTYIPCSCPNPLRGIVGLYDYRLRIGKNTPEGKAAKLVYNSMYGKFAQSLGEPVYGNPIYASLITSGCRTSILDAIATHPKGAEAVVMVATDGIYFTEPHPTLPVSDKLGEWDYAEKTNLTLFKPGVYWDDTTRMQIRDGDNPVFKARGISAKDFAREIQRIDDHYSRWQNHYPEERDPTTDREGWHPRIKYLSGFGMITCKQAIQWNKWFLAGAIRNKVELVQDADPISKRRSGHYTNGIYWSQPHHDGGPELESTPYDRRFGQPEHDPEEFGYNEDGYVLDTWRAIMRE